MSKNLHSTSSFRTLNILHILNDGFNTSLVLFLPFFVTDLPISLTEAGLLGTILNSLGMLCALPAGYIAARFGGIKILILSSILYGAGYIATGMSSSYGWILFSFAIAGIGFGFFHPVAFAVVAQTSEKKKMGKNMGNFTAVGDLGKMVIPAILTFIVVVIGWQTTAILYGVIAIACGVLFFILQKERTNLLKVAEEKTKVSHLHILSHPPFFLALATSFLDTFSSASLFVFLPFLLLNRGIDAAFLGTFSAMFFLGSMFGKSILGHFSDTYNNATIVILSELLMAICIALLAYSTSIIIIIICSIIVGIFTKGTVPVIQTMISDASKHHENFEKSFGISGLNASIALTISPVFLGFIAQKWGIEATFFVMSAIALLAIIPAFLFRLSSNHHTLNSITSSL